MKYKEQSLFDAAPYCERSQKSRRARGRSRMLLALEIVIISRLWPVITAPTPEEYVMSLSEVEIEECHERVEEEYTELIEELDELYLEDEEAYYDQTHRYLAHDKHIEYLERLAQTSTVEEVRQLIEGLFDNRVDVYVNQFPDRGDVSNFVKPEEMKHEDMVNVAHAIMNGIQAYPKASLDALIEHDMLKYINLSAGLAEIKRQGNDYTQIAHYGGIANDTGHIALNARSINGETVIHELWHLQDFLNLKHGSDRKDFACLHPQDTPYGSLVGADPDMQLESNELMRLHGHFSDPYGNTNAAEDIAETGANRLFRHSVKPHRELVWPVEYKAARLLIDSAAVDIGIAAFYIDWVYLPNNPADLDLD